MEWIAADDVPIADITDHLLHHAGMKGHRISLAVAAYPRVAGELQEDPVQTAEVGWRIRDDECPGIGDLHSDTTPEGPGSILSTLCPRGQAACPPGASMLT